MSIEAETRKKQFLKQMSKESIEKLPSQVSQTNKKDLFQIKHHVKSNRAHPYSKSLYERSQSDPARSGGSSLLNRFRRKSESPYSRHSKPCSPVDGHPTSLRPSRHGIHDDIRRPNSSHDASTSRTTNDVNFYPTESRLRVGSNPQHSDSDEVFKDEAERESSAMVFAELMKQRNLLLDKSYPLPPSPELLANMNKQKFSK